MTILDISPDELVIDNFAGGGGASTGIEQALGRPIDIAINHDREAISLHAMNHPGTRHLCEDVWKVNIKAEVSAGGFHHAEVRAMLELSTGTPQTAIVTVEGEQYAIVDIGMRMLSPRELFNAQGFPQTYIIEEGRDVCAPQGGLFGSIVTLSKTAQIRMCGNSVSPQVACAIIGAQFQPAVREVAA